MTVHVGQGFSLFWERVWTHAAVKVYQAFSEVLHFIDGALCTSTGINNFEKIEHAKTDHQTPRTRHTNQTVLQNTNDSPDDFCSKATQQLSEFGSFVFCNIPVTMLNLG